MFVVRHRVDRRTDRKRATSIDAIRQHPLHLHASRFLFHRSLLSLPTVESIPTSISFNLTKAKRIKYILFYFQSSSCDWQRVRWRIRFAQRTEIRLQHFACFNRQSRHNILPNITYISVFVFCFFVTYNNNDNNSFKKKQNTFEAKVMVMVQMVLQTTFNFLKKNRKIEKVGIICIFCLRSQTISKRTNRCIACQTLK